MPEGQEQSRVNQTGLSADSPRLGPPENRAGTPVQLAIDFLPLLDLSIVGSLFNLAINWESSSRMSCSIFFLSEWGIHFLMYCVLNTSNLGKWLLDGLPESPRGSWWKERERAPFLKGRKYGKGGINTGFWDITGVRPLNSNGIPSS